MARTNREARVLDGAAEREFICFDGILPFPLPLLRFFASFICLFYAGAIFMGAGTPRMHPSFDARELSRAARVRERVVGSRRFYDRFRSADNK
jgi:hypothetical protein